MIVRNLEPNDLYKLKELHEQFFKEEFPFPDFYDHFLGLFAIEEDNEIIVAGGVKTITESVLITNKNAELHTKLLALNSALQVSEFLCRGQQYNQLHAFIKDDVVWRAWLKKAGFRKSNGNAYLLNI